MAHVAQYKKDVVAEFEKAIMDNPIIGAVDMENLPTRTLQKMREQLRGTASILMTKKRLMKIALENTKDKKKGIEELEKYLRGMPALLFTKDNPFLLFQTLKKNKSSAPAKAGQTAPKDIVVPAGPTPFLPGPIIGELGGIGVKTGIEGGKVAVKEDSTVAKEGDVISAKLAGLLVRLGIEPMEIGLNVTAVYEDGLIYDRSVLDVNVEDYMDNLKLAATESFNLAYNAGFPTFDTITVMVQSVFRDSRALAIETGILNSEVVGDILAKANNQATGLKAKLEI